MISSNYCVWSRQSSRFRSVNAKVHEGIATIILEHYHLVKKHYWIWNHTFEKQYCWHACHAKRHSTRSPDSVSKLTRRYHHHRQAPSAGVTVF